MFTIATWNINSVRLRAGLVTRLLGEEAPDILCLQECKSPVEKIPAQLFHDAGYRWMVARGQRGYNGVAILSRLPITDAGERDHARLGHARHVAARLENGVTIHNFYVPAGGDVPDREVNDKFGQKLDFLQRMTDWSAAIREPSIILGDFNTTDQSEDYHKITAIFHDSVREVGLGLGQTFPDSTSWRNLQFIPPFIRIDYVFYSSELQAVSAGAWHQSAGSDHRPTVASLILTSA